MKSINCRLALQDGTEIDFRHISYSVGIMCGYAFQTMAHDFWASTITDLTDIEQSLALLRVTYHISFAGHAYKELRSFEKVVPIIKRYF